jgi:hypothetical protein
MENRANALGQALNSIGSKDLKLFSLRWRDELGRKTAFLSLLSCQGSMGL